MFRFITVNYCKRKLKLNKTENNIAYIKPKYKYDSEMNLLNKNDRQIVISGNKKFIYLFDTKTNHEIYKGSAKRFELIIFKKGHIKPCAYIDMDKVLTEVLGTNKINYESVKLKKTITEWLYNFSNICDSIHSSGRNGDFEKMTYDIYLKIFKDLNRHVEGEFTLC